MGVEAVNHQDAGVSRQETRERLEQTLDHAIEGCQIISPDFRYVYVNRTVAKQGHKARRQLLGRTMMEVYPGIERTDMFKYLKRCMRQRKVQRLENEFEYPDGSKGWFELRMEPVPEGALIFSQDISTRKQAESALVKAMEDLRTAKDEIDLEKTTDQAILESIGDGLIAIDAEAKIMMVNPAAEAMLGRKAAELQGTRITELPMLGNEGRRIPAAERPIYSVLHSGATVGPAFTGNYFVHKDKGKFPVGLTATPLRLDGKITGAIEIFRDISKEQEVDKAKTEFVSIASHQLRTPLGLMKWYLEAIQQDGLDSLSNVTRGYLDEIYTSNERVLQVVRELLSVSRIDQDSVKNDSGRVDTVRLAKDIVDEMTPAAAAKRIKLNLRAESGRTYLYLDKMRLHEVLQNLVANALEYTPHGGKVTVAVDKPGHNLIMSVTDNGMGITDKDRVKLFTKFFRSEEAALNNPDGSGLGLYVVKSYVEGWGGTVAVRSRHGKGTTFTITLPYKGGAK